MGWNLVKELEMEGRETGLWQAESCVMLKLVFSAEGSTNAKRNEMAAYV